MDKSNFLTFTAFSIILVFGILTYYPFSDNANLTDQGIERLGSFEVDTDWEFKGTLDNLRTNEDIIYTDANEKGNWTSELITGSDIDILDYELESDLRDGTVEVFINGYNNSEGTGSPDQTYYRNINDSIYTEKLNVGNYESYEFVFRITETSNSANQRPSIDYFKVNYVDNLERSGLGMDNRVFQIFTLFFMIGIVLLTLSKGVGN